MHMLGLIAVIALAVSTAQALAQVLRPAPISSLTTPTERVWAELLKTEKSQRWETGWRVQAVLIPAPEDHWPESDPSDIASEPAKVPDADAGMSPTPETPEGLKPARPLRAVFAMPWVQESATQRSDPASVKMQVRLNDAPMEAEYVWLRGPRSMERVRGAIITIPRGMELAYTATSGAAQTSRALIADLYIEFTNTAARVRLNDEMARLAEWPDEWPEDARGAMDPQVFLDTGVDRGNGRVLPLDMASLDWIAADIARRRGINDVRKSHPMKVIREVAAEVCDRLRMGGDGVVPSAMAVKAARKLRGGATTIVGLADVAGAFEGIDVRDALTTLRGNGIANAAERATTLAAVYRRLGIPARVVVGVVGEDAKRDDVVRKMVERERDKAANEAPIWNPCDPRSRFKPVDLGLVKPPRLRFWVEAAVYHRDYGLGWVPVDPGKGGESWTVGRIEGSEGIAVLATNWWPPSIAVVGIAPQKPPTQFGMVSNVRIEYSIRVSANGKVEMQRSMSKGGGSIDPRCPEPRVEELAAGLWGFWLEGSGARCVFQQLGAHLRKGSVRAGD